MYHLSNRGWSKLVILTFIVLISAQQAYSTTVIKPSDETLVTDARAIITGRVLSITTGRDDTDRIFTYIKVRVLSSLKGDITSRNVVLKEEGGELNGEGSIIFGTPTFRVGEKVLLYLDTWQDGSLRVRDMFLGKFSIIMNAETGREAAVRMAPDTEIVVLNGDPDFGQTVPSTDRMELEEYVQHVRELVSSTRENSEAFHRTAYSDTPLLGQPAEFESLVSSGSINPSYTFISPSTPPRWFEATVFFNVNTNEAPSGATDDILAAMSAWSNVSGSSLEVAMGGTTSSCRSSSTENVMVFNGCDGRWQPSSGCSSILALGGLGWTSQTTVINGTTFFRAVAGFVSFNPYASCSYSNHCNVQEIAAHELGHALGLGHSQDSSATMAAFAHFDGRCASLRSDDQAGARFIYPSTGGGGGSLSITTVSPLQVGTVGSPYTANLAASGGSTPYTWSLLSGALPGGLSLSTGGSISGTPSGAGTSTFTVQVRDAQSATAQKEFSLTISSGGSPLNSTFVSQTVPTTLTPSQSFSANLKWTNTGTETWGPGFRIVSKNPDFNTTWGGNTVPLTNFSVASSQTLDLTFTAFAPSTPGTYNFQWQLFRDTGQTFFGQVSVNVSITVGQSTPPPPPPAISGPSSAEAVRGTAFSLQFTGSGGRTPYSWSLASGTLPTGITLNSSSGLLSGTPTVQGSFASTIRLTDADQRTADKALTINVASGAPPVISTSSLPNGTRGIPYGHQLTATGGTTPYGWSISGGSLPGGMAIVPGTGLLSGTPTVSGDFSVTVTVTDSAQRTGSKTFNLRIDNPAPNPLLLASVPPIEVLRGSGVSYQLSASGGTQPYTWSISSGSLPPGVSLNPSSGLISGTASTAGQFTAQAMVRDQANQSISTSVQIKVIDPDNIPSIVRVKYKNGKKLIVTSQRADSGAVILVDGWQRASTSLNQTDSWVRSRSHQAITKSG